MAEYILALEDDLKNQVNYCAFSSNCLNLTLVIGGVIFLYLSVVTSISFTLNAIC
jgi:hypothetical protein